MSQYECINCYDVFWMTSPFVVHNIVLNLCKYCCLIRNDPAQYRVHCADDNYFHAETDIDDISPNDKTALVRYIRQRRLKTTLMYEFYKLNKTYLFF